MVHYEKSLRQCRRPGWEPAYLNYKKLKKILRELELYLEDRNTNRILQKVSSIVAFDEREFQEILVEEYVENNEAHVANGTQQQSMSSLLQHEANPASLELGVELSHGIEVIKDRFFQELGREIEKMSLFALKMEGILSDSIGALRFDYDGTYASIFSKNEAFFTDFAPTTNDTSNLEFCLIIGVELLYVLQYVGVNTLGVRKILKKYNKIIRRLDDPKQTYRMGKKDDIHLHELTNSQAIIAVETSLQSALVQFYYTDQDLDNDPEKNLNYFRLQTIIQSSHIIRKNAEIVSHPFNEFLGQKAMINLGNIAGNEKRAVTNLMKFDPKALLSYDTQMLESFWMQWLPQFKYWKSRRTVLAQEEDWSRLNDSSRIAMLFLQSEDEKGYTLGKISPQSETVRRKAWGGVDRMSMILNLFSILLYTINYYIVAPTANHYAILLGLDGAYGATLIGASSLAAVFAAFLYSLWYTMGSFRSALIFSSICPLVGNLMYGLAISYDSMGMALAGRILCGFGSAEVINRQLISACVSFKDMTRASAYFVAFGASGMSIGPLIAAILDILVGRDLKVDLHLHITPAGGVIFNHVTSPAFTMACLWLLELVALMFFFREPDRVNASELDFSDDQIIEEGDDDDSGDETVPLQPAHYGSIPDSRQSILGSTASMSSEFAMANDYTFTGIWHELSRSLSLCRRSPGLLVTLVIFCFIELTDEVVISSCSMVARRYFGWHGAAAGFLIAGLGALVLPANFVVENLSHRISERRILIASLWVVLVGCLGILNYQGMYYDILGVSQYGGFDPIINSTELKTLELGGFSVGQIFQKRIEFPYDWSDGPYIYITFLSVIFMGTIVLEGVDTSIMAKVTPPQLNTSFFNSGLLATLIGTLGRVIADALITLSALLDVHVFIDFVNATFLPLVVFTIGCILMVNSFYNKLV